MCNTCLFVCFFFGSIFLISILIGTTGKNCLEKKNIKIINEAEYVGKK